MSKLIALTDFQQGFVLTCTVSAFIVHVSYIFSFQTVTFLHVSEYTVSVAR